MILTYLDCCQGSHNCWRSEAMGDQGEMSEMSLNALVQNHARLSVTQRRPVLIQQIHQLLCDQPGQRDIAISKILSSHPASAYLVASSNSFRLYCSPMCSAFPDKNSATCLAGNSDSQT